MEWIHTLFFGSGIGHSILLVAIVIFIGIYLGKVKIAGAMEGLNSTLLLRQLFTPRRDKKLTQTLDQLTTAVEKLNALLEDSSFPPQPSKPEEQ